MTLDNFWHALAAALLVYLLHFLGPWSLPAALALLFFAREMEQAATRGERWRVWAWSWQKHSEWIVPAAVAFATFGII